MNAEHPASQRKPKVALLGCGAVSQLYYAPALRELESCALLQVAALLDPHTDAAARLHNIFPTSAVTHSLEDLLRRDFDLAIVATPHALHAEQTIRLLEAGRSVLCEKPMATSLSAAQAMIDASSSKQAVLAIGMLRRFFPATQTIERMLALGVLGEITSFSFCEGDRFSWPVSSTSYFRRAEAHGGVLMDIGVHALDLLIWWFGEPAELEYEDDAMGGIEVNCRLRCRHAGGFHGEVRLSRDCTLANRYTISGTNGWLSWQANEANSLRVSFNQSRFVLNAAIEETEQRVPHAGAGRPAKNFEQSFMSQVCNVLAAMQGREALRVTAEDAIRSLRLIDRCYRTRSLMAQPWLQADEAACARRLNADSR